MSVKFSTKELKELASNVELNGEYTVEVVSVSLTKAGNVMMSIKSELGFTNIVFNITNPLMAQSAARQMINLVEGFKLRAFDGDKMKGLSFTAEFKSNKGYTNLHKFVAFN